MQKTELYERMTIAGIEMDVKKVETLYLARSPRYAGFLTSGRTLEDIAEKLPKAMLEFEQFVGEGERDAEVRKSFAKLLADEHAAADKHVAFNLDPERVMTLQAIRTLCAVLWPHDFGTEREKTLFKVKWAEDDKRLRAEIEQEVK